MIETAHAIHRYDIAMRYIHAKDKRFKQFIKNVLRIIVVQKYQNRERFDYYTILCKLLRL